MKREEYKITLSLNIGQVNQLSGLAVAMNAFHGQYGETALSEADVLKCVLGRNLESLLKREKECYLFLLEKPQSEDDKEAGDVPARNPSPETAPDEPEQEPETVSNAGEASAAAVGLTFSVTEGRMIHDALSSAGQHVLMRRFPHVWLYPVEDEASLNAVWDGDTSVTLNADECETIANALFMRACSLADAGYATMSKEHFDLLRRVTDAALDKPLPFFEDGGAAPDDAPEDSLPVSDGHGGTEWKPIDEIEAKREAAQGIYAGEPPEPQMEDRSDVYFRLLEGGDCLAEPSEATLDFVDAFFVRS